MVAFWIIVGIVATVAAILLIGTYICFMMAFYSKKRVPSEEYRIPDGEIYEPYRDIMVGWMKEARNMPFKEYSITSFDGLTLWGKYYEYE